MSQGCYSHTDSVTSDGQLAIQLIGEAVLGKPALDERELTATLACTTVRSVLAARQLCLAALQASISPANCFRIFRFAQQCGIGPLQLSAEQCCMACLAEAARVTAVSSSTTGPDPTVPGAECSVRVMGTEGLDVEGFKLLAPEHLQQLLASDSLQVSSEFDVFHAIAAWAHARPQERRPLVADLVRCCVRLGAMPLGELEELDRISDGPEVIRLVAQAYILRILGSPLDGPAGVRPRASAQCGGAMTMASGATRFAPVGRAMQQQQ